MVTAPPSLPPAHSLRNVATEDQKEEFQRSLDESNHYDDYADIDHFGDIHVRMDDALVMFYFWEYNCTIR